MITLMLESVTQPPSGEVSVLLCIAGWAFPSITHCKVEAGLELDVEHSNIRVCPTFAVEGPLISTRSGATKTYYSNYNRKCYNFDKR